MAPINNKNGNGNYSSVSFSSEQVSKGLKVAGTLCVGMLTLFLLVLTMGAIKAYPNIGEGGGIAGIQNTISVSGQAEMEVHPDVTIFSWSNQADGKTVAEAQTKVTNLSNQAMSYVKSKGIPAADIKTIGFNTETKYDNKYVPCVYDMPINPSASPSRIMPPCSNTQSVPSGYTTYETVEVKVRNIDKEPSKVGEMIAALGQIGVKVGGPNSTVDNPDASKNAVRTEAIRKARVEAENLARALGVKLVRVVGFNENSSYPYAYGSARMESKAMDAVAVPAPQIEAGTNRITAQVNITYEIR